MGTQDYIATAFTGAFQQLTWGCSISNVRANPGGVPTSEEGIPILISSLVQNPRRTSFGPWGVAGVAFRWEVVCA